MRALVILLSLMLAACAGRETEMVLARPGDLPAAVQIGGVPFFPQAEKACGPAALAMMLAWSGLPAVPDRMSAQVYTAGREGSLATDMLGAARRNGRLAVPVDGLAALLGELAVGHPVLVLQNLGLDIHPVWHFAVAIGYDLPARQLVLHSGLDEGLRMSLDTFEHTWVRSGRWALVVLVPGESPATSAERPVVEAAAGLERVGLPAAAARAYESALARWPDSLSAALGLGNARYAAGEQMAALWAFRHATERHPDSAPAWNNLAHVLLEQGKRPEARHAAQRAVQLGGGEAIYLATLGEALAD